MDKKVLIITESKFNKIKQKYHLIENVIDDIEQHGEWHNAYPDDNNYYNMGNKFICNDNIIENEKYILSHVGYSKVCLIGIVSGNFWTNPIKVNNINKITEEEFNIITGKKSNKFKKVNE